MDQRQEETAASLLNTLSFQAIAAILRDYGEEPRATAIAKAIVRERARRPLQSTGQLVDLVHRVHSKRGKINPATRVFQALRIAVNHELENLMKFLSDAYLWLRPGGVLAVVSFHSLEHRIIKREFQKWGKDCICPAAALECRCGWSRKTEPLFRKPLKPSADEMIRNPRSRSAQLRAVRRVGKPMEDS